MTKTHWNMAMRNHALGMLRLRLREDKVLSAGYVAKIMREFGKVLAEETERCEQVQLRQFMNDEMAKCANVVKLRKLALCRIGDPRYVDYRKKYFDGQEARV